MIHNNGHHLPVSRVFLASYPLLTFATIIYSFQVAAVSAAQEFPFSTDERHYCIRSDSVRTTSTDSEVNPQLSCGSTNTMSIIGSGILTSLAIPRLTGLGIIVSFVTIRSGLDTLLISN